MLQSYFVKCIKMLDCVLKLSCYHYILQSMTLKQSDTLSRIPRGTGALHK